MEHKETNVVRDEASGTVREESTVVNESGSTPTREASMVKSSTPKLLGANAHAGFAQFTYGLTDFFLAPFKGLLPTIVSGQSVLELSLIFAILIYSLIALGLVRLVAISLSRSVMVSQHSRSEGLKPRSE